MNSTILSVATLFALTLTLTERSLGANLLANPGFEDPITMDGPPFVGSWEGFFGGDGSSSANSAAMPRSGAQSLELSIVDTVNTFAGAFQDVDGLLSGEEFTFAGWHASPSDPLNLGVELRIEWRDSIANTEISRTPNSTPVPTSEYSLFSLTASVPAGADTARVVYAVQTFGASGDGDNRVFVDDTSFKSTAAPAPVPDAAGSLGLLLFAVNGLVLLRRKLARR